MRVGIGLSESAYAQACGRLGRQVAADILAVVAEKALRDPEKISSPGGYLVRPEEPLEALHSLGFQRV